MPNNPIESWPPPQRYVIWERSLVISLTWFILFSRFPLAWHSKNRLDARRAESFCVVPRRRTELLQLLDWRGEHAECLGHWISEGSNRCSECTCASALFGVQSEGSTLFSLGDGDRSNVWNGFIFCYQFQLFLWHWKFFHYLGQLTMFESITASLWWYRGERTAIKIVSMQSRFTALRRTWNSSAAAQQARFSGGIWEIWKRQWTLYWSVHVAWWMG